MVAYCPTEMLNGCHGADPSVVIGFGLYDFGSLNVEVVTDHT